MFETIMGIVAILVIVIIVWAASQSTTGVKPRTEPKQQVDVYIHEEPMAKNTPFKETKSLSEQLDGRITNVFKNPWEDIL